MGVPAHDHLNLAGGRFRLQLLDIMQHVNGNRSLANELTFWNRFRPWSLVVIAAHRNDLSDLLQSIEHFRITNVAGVENQTDTFENGEHFGAEKAMRIGNDTDLVAFVFGGPLGIEVYSHAYSRLCAPQCLRGNDEYSRMCPL